MSETPITDTARKVVEANWKDGGFQGFSEEEWLEKLEALERDLAQARKDESKVSGLLFDEIAHREKAEKERDEAQELLEHTTNGLTIALQERDAAHTCLREVRVLLRDTHQSGAVIESVQLIDKALGETNG